MSEKLIQYVAFLRGINVGGHKLIKMDELAKIFASLGLKEVKTLIASGNVIFQAAEKSSSKLIKTIEEGLKKALGYEVKVLLRTIKEIADTVKNNPFKKIKLDADLKMYVTFLGDKPKTKLAIPFKSDKDSFEIVEISGAEIFSLSLPMANGRFGNPVLFIEKNFGKLSTTRNWNTLVKIALLKIN